jgi:myo-inositol catabolism protein IolC
MNERPIKQRPGKLGHEHPLYVLPFDHRFPYACEVFGFAEAMSAEQVAQATDLKRVIYEALEQAIAAGLPAHQAALLVDERFGADLLRDAAARGLTTILPIEKSGASEFTLEYGESWREHVERFDPTFVKVLVQLNPGGDAARNERQLAQLVEVSDYCRPLERQFMFELIVPPEPGQLSSLGGDREKFDLELRPALMVEAIERIQDAGIEPDVWKIEGLDSRGDCRRVADAVRRGGRDEVGCVVLGRGENEARVRHWLETAAATPGFIGFAVGRSIFASPLVALRAGQATREAAAAEIAQRFRRLVDTFEHARGPAARSGV